MEILKKLFGNKRPNIEKLKKAYDFNGLIKALEYTNNSEDLGLPVVAAAADALGDLGDLRAVTPLKEALADIDRLENLQNSLNDLTKEVGYISPERIELRKIVNQEIRKVRQKITDSLNRLNSLGQSDSIISAKTEKDYSGYSRAVIYCKADFDISSMRLPGFTGNAEVIRSGSAVTETEIVAAMLLKGCDKNCILVSPPDYGIGFFK